MEDDRFSRQKLLFGEEGQKAIGRERIGIVGLGGIGSQVNLGLAYLGVQNFVLVDKDTVERTNLNRLIGATENDAQKAIPKVQVAERVIRCVTPEAKVESYQATNRNRAAISALKTCTSIFGCVDNDGARLILSELAAAYTIPLIDSATEIIPPNGSNREEIIFGGRVVVAQPGEFCLFCADEIDPKIAQQDLEDENSRKVREIHGYGLGEQTPSPATISLNGIIANLAITEFLVMVTGLRKPNKYLHYKGERGMVSPRLLERKPDCFTCNYLVGLKDEANIDRYVLEG